ncbi:MAG TPA: glycosyltransferase family 2 protein [Acidimicrobiales bacterium]|nr:glycosyltransferase family 2 protein [Acidimicrobiales bacterium]
MTVSIGEIPRRVLGGRQGLGRYVNRRRLGPDARIEAPTPLARRPRVSVVVPCYKYGHYLPTCLESALGQPGVEVDVVVVDDASPDGSGEVAEELAAGDPRITVIRHRRNAGHIATYNDGLEAADGDYVVLLSADDLLAPGALGRAAALLEAEPSVGFAYGHAEVFSDRPPAAGRQDVGSWTIWPGRSWARIRWQMARNAIWCPEVVMRGEVQRRIGGYRADLPHTGDLEMWLRAAAVADVGRVDGPDQAYYRVHGANMHSTTFDGLADLEERRRTFEELATVHPDEGDHRAARRALAGEALVTAERLLGARPVDREAVDELVAFAVDTYPSVEDLPEWRQSERWLAMDPDALRRHPAFLARELRRRGKDVARRWYWRAVGV